MGPISSDQSKENIYNFNTKQIKEKAGAWYKKTNFLGFFKAPFKLIAAIFTYLLGVEPSPFTSLINSLFDIYFQNITQSQSKFLVKTLNDEFSNIYKSIKLDLELLIKIIIKKDNIFEKTRTQFEKNQNQLKNNSEKSKEINILLIGKTGVGKSTLINTLLNLDKENMAEETFGKVGTLDYKKYSSKHWKNINLIDSRGLDFGKSFQHYQRETINYVRKSNKDIFRFIDIVYYCFKDNRFENEEKQLLLSLKEIYNEINVPFIFVYTQDVTCNFEGMKEYVKQELNDENLIIVDILARDKKLKNGTTVEAYGIKELKEETIKKISDIKLTAFYKKFYNNCLDQLYKSEEIDCSYILNNLIQTLILNNRKKYNFGEYKKFDEKLDANILNQMKKINDLFVKNFNNSLFVLTRLVRDYQAESKVRAKRNDKNNEYDLNSSEKKEKAKIIESCNLSILQDDIKKIIIGEYANCLNKFIDEMFEKELKDIYNKYIVSMINYESL